MIVLAMALIGAVLGGLTARKRNGTRADIAQYAVGYAIAFGLAGMVATLVIHRVMV
ncbi:apolipoprotein acyltransferase [Ruegeria sediminis]|uniref:Apolipoprotein acyltransferase n=1 Tax=Ruegeria sediminis TaxID=2583820 RepID=A0ABY2WV39_9RHOB|nr:apolipoprotein acyltransferase [Ruegeria sediminis]TMV06475.1 apolipoprotein acyltransferase [Ruegeria sediminis]